MRAGMMIRPGMFLDVRDFLKRLVSAMSCLSQRDSKRRAEQRRRGVLQVLLAGVLAPLYDSIH